MDKKTEAAFLAAVKAADTNATLVGETQGLDYSTGHPADLLLYRSDAPPPKADAD